jgi:Holliday junction resolvase-like predicted endonuclease
VGNYKELGEKYEALALRFYLLHGYRLKAQRFKTKVAEIDLVLTSPEGHLVLVEVKSKSQRGFEAFRVSTQQKNRLRRAHQFFSAQWSHVESHLAIVSQDGKVEVHRDYLSY